MPGIRYSSNIYFQSCADFSERWDQPSFDFEFRAEKLEHFVPLVREVFGRHAFDPGILRPGTVVGLPPRGAERSILTGDN